MEEESVLHCFKASLFDFTGLSLNVQEPNPQKFTLNVHKGVYELK